MTDQVRVRFVIADTIDPSLLEAAIDEVSICAVSPRVEAPPARVTRIVQILPNPFRSSATIAYDLLEPAQARVAVFDVQGRRVATLADEPQEVGRHEVVWDGRDARGSDAPAGVYWVRLDAGRTNASRLLRVR